MSFIDTLTWPDIRRFLVGCLFISGLLVGPELAAQFMGWVTGHFGLSWQIVLIPFVGVVAFRYLEDWHRALRKRQGTPAGNGAPLVTRPND